MGNTGLDYDFIFHLVLLRNDEFYDDHGYERKVNLKNYTHEVSSGFNNPKCTENFSKAKGESLRQTTLESSQINQFPLLN